MHFSILVFPGSNCDADSYHVVTEVLGQKADYVWHKEASLPQTDCVILPGGFSYGDYLRCGAIARFSPIMKSVVQFANQGGKVIGICNGFQILTESALLPGALLRNKNLKFICKDVYVKVVHSRSVFTQKSAANEVLRIPIAHAEGNYFIEDEGLKRLQDQGQILFQYSTMNGELNEEANPNGSLLNIAGITNEKGNVVGLMPHPERVAESVLGGLDGLKLWESLLA